MAIARSFVRYALGKKGSAKPKPVTTMAVGEEAGQPPTKPKPRPKAKKKPAKRK